MKTKAINNAIFLIASMLLLSLMVAGSGLDGWYPMNNNIFRDYRQSDNVIADYGPLTAVTSVSTASYQLKQNAESISTQTARVSGLSEVHAIFMDSNLRVVALPDFVNTYSLGGTAGCTGNIEVQDIDEDGIVEVMLVCDDYAGTNSFIELELKDGEFSINETILPDNWNLNKSGVACFKNTGEPPACYFRTAHSRYIKLWLHNQTIVEYNNTYRATAREIPYTPLVANINQDSSPEDVEAYFINYRSIEPTTHVMEYLMLDAQTMTPKTSFSVDGFINISFGSSTANELKTIWQPSLIQTDDVYSGSTPYEIVNVVNVWNTSDNTGSYKIYAFDSTGAILFQNDYHPNRVDALMIASNVVPHYELSGYSPVALCHLQKYYFAIGIGRQEMRIVCTDGAGGSETVINITGYENKTGSPLVSGTPEYLNVPNDVGALYSADADNSGTYDFITSIGIINTTGGIIYNLTQHMDYSYTNYTPIPVPDEDDKLAFLMINANKSRYIYSTTAGITNSAPILTHSYNRNYANPICLNTALQVSALEYDENNATVPTGANYYNAEDTDEERLVSKCVSGASLVNGDWDENNPEINCTYSSVGNFVATIYLQDDFNPSDYLTFDSFVVEVVDGIAGTDCNIAPESPTGLIGKPTGFPCDDGDECASRNCEYMVCTLKGLNAECLSDSQCISGDCFQNRCTKPSLWQMVDTSKSQLAGDDDNSNNLISMIIMLVIPAMIITVGRSGLAVLGGLAFFFVSGFFFAIVGWLSPFILLGMVIIALVIFVLIMMIRSSSE